MPLFPAAGKGDTDARADRFDRPHLILTRRFRNALVRRAAVEQRTTEVVAEAGFAPGLQRRRVAMLEFAMLLRVSARR
ncbi:MAG TPA: hypothetical protein VMA53_15585 [Stellaceae bacterium]|nr:hypothetical protein [Stellaceae bacterium]